MAEASLSMEYLKMTKPSIQIHNLKTDEIIVREMNNEEFAAHQIIIENDKKQYEELQAKAQAKAQLLKRLGITEDEAKLLLS
jgi:hypothetical protein